VLFDMQDQRKNSHNQDPTEVENLCSIVKLFATKM